MILEAFVDATQRYTFATADESDWPRAVSSRLRAVELVSVIGNTKDDSVPLLLTAILTPAMHIRHMLRMRCQRCMNTKHAGVHMTDTSACTHLLDTMNIQCLLGHEEEQIG